MRHSAASNVVEHTQVAALDAGTVHLVTKGVGGGCPGVTCSMPTLVDIHAFQSEAPHCVGGSLSWSIPICRHPAITVLASSTAGDIRADKTCRVPRSEQMESAEKIRCVADASAKMAAEEIVLVSVQTVSPPYTTWRLCNTLEAARRSAGRGSRC